MSLGVLTCAGAILRPGQETGAARIGDYGQARRRSRGAKAPGPSGCALADARGVAPLGRWPRIAPARRALRIASLGHNADG